MSYVISQGIVTETFDNPADWALTTADAVADTVNVKEGSSSLRLTPNVPGTQGFGTKTISLDLSKAGRQYIWLYIPTSSDLAGISAIQFLLSNDAGFTNYFSRSINGTSFHEGWNKLLLSRNQWTDNGSPSWASSFVRIRVRITPITAATPTVCFDSLVSQSWERPKCVITFDDGWLSQYTDAYPYMSQLGFKGTVYVIKKYIDQNALYFTSAQIQEMFNAGWDIANHTENHVNMTTLGTYAEVESEIKNCRDWIIANGWNRKDSAYHVAYPNGGYNDNVLQACANLSMLTGRTIIDRTQAHVMDEKYLILRQQQNYQNVAATYKNYIDRALAEGGCVILNYHRIMADGVSSDTTMVDKSQFIGMMDYLASKRGQIDVVTLTDWYRGLSSSRRVL